MSRKKSTLLFVIVFVFACALIYQYTGVTPLPEPGSRTHLPDMNKELNDPGQALATKQIRVSVPMSPAEFAELNRLNREFQSKHKHIEVTISNVTLSDAYDQFKLSLAMGEAPDIMLLNNDWVREFAVRGLLLPVDDLLSSELRADQLEQLFTPLQWNGMVWGIPKDMDPYVFVWNEPIFRELGIYTIQNDNWLEAAHMLVSETERSPLFYFDATDPYALLASLRYFGLEESQLPLGSNRFEWLTDSITRVLFGTHDENGNGMAEDTVQNDELEEKQQAPWLLHTDSVSAWKQMEQGELAAMVTTLSRYLKHPDGRFKLFEADTRTGHLPLSGLTRGRSYVVNSETDAEDEVRLWLQWMTSSEAQDPMWKEAGVLPTLKSLYQKSYAVMHPVLREVPKIAEDSWTIPADPNVPDRLKRTAYEIEQWDGVDAGVVKRLSLIWSEAELSSP